MNAVARAQALVWLSLALPIFVGITGLAIDGALLLATRRELQSVVDGAARAGATRLDQQLLRGSAGGHVQLDPVAARSAAIEYLGEHLRDGVPWATPPRAEVSVGERRVHVEVRGSLSTAFMRVLQIERVPVGATSFADVQFGIRGPDGR
jgi:hypothetical protein